MTENKLKEFELTLINIAHDDFIKNYRKTGYTEKSPVYRNTNNPIFSGSNMLHWLENAKPKFSKSHFHFWPDLKNYAKIQNGITKYQAWREKYEQTLTKMEKEEKFISLIPCIRKKFRLQIHEQEQAF